LKPGSTPKRRKKTYKDWWMERLNELHGFDAEAKNLYAVTSLAMEADSWAILKLAFLSNYADMYTSIIKSKIGHAYYIDTNAGCGLDMIQDVGNAIVFGSPLVAARKPKKPFDGYVLIEKKAEYCDALRKIIPQAVVVNGDANSDVGDLTGATLGLRHALSLVPAGTPMLILIDPYGMDIRWRTVEMALKTWSDVIINFQSVSRVVGSALRNEKYGNTLTDFFGTDAWRACDTYEDCLELYMSQVRKHKDIVFSIRIQGRQAYHYYLIVAIKKTSGDQGWIGFIERMKENVEKADANDVETFMNIFSNKQQTLFD